MTRYMKWVADLLWIIWLKKTITMHEQLNAAAVRLVDIKKYMETLISITNIKDRKNQAYINFLQRALSTMNRSAD